MGAALRAEAARLESSYAIGRLLVIREILGQAPKGFSAATKCFCTEHEQAVAEFAARVLGASGMLWTQIVRGLCCRACLHDHGRHLEHPAEHPRGARPRPSTPNRVEQPGTLGPSTAFSCCSARRSLAPRRGPGVCRTTRCTVPAGQPRGQNGSASPRRSRCVVRAYAPRAPSSPPRSSSARSRRRRRPAGRRRQRGGAGAVRRPRRPLRLRTRRPGLLHVAGLGPRLDLHLLHDDHRGHSVHCPHHAVGGRCHQIEISGGSPSVDSRACRERAPDSGAWDRTSWLTPTCSTRSCARRDLEPADVVLGGGRRRRRADRAPRAPGRVRARDRAGRAAARPSSSRSPSSTGTSTSSGGTPCAWS